MAWPDLGSPFEEPDEVSSDENQESKADHESTSIKDVRKNGGLRKTGEPQGKVDGKADEETIERVKGMTKKEREEALAKASNRPLDEVLDEIDGGIGNAAAVAEELADHPSVIGSKKAAQVENQDDELSQDDHSRTNDFREKEKQRDQERKRNRRDNHDGA